MKTHRVLWIVVLMSAIMVQAQDVLRVRGRFLTTPCGDTVVLRGVNKMCIFDANNYGIPVFREVKQTGANVLRIVWNMSSNQSTAEGLDRVLQACIDNAMIPMVEMHDATGQWEKIDEVVDYLLRADYLAVLKKHEKYILINVANEPGDFTISSDMFSTTCARIVGRFRVAGIRAPLVFDATGYGQDIDILLSTSPAITAKDPLRNVMYSFHAYLDPKYYHDPPTLLATKLDEAVQKNVPLIIGEFTGCYLDDPISSDNLWMTILPLCEQQRIGWIAWEWGPGNADYSKDPPVLYPKMDMTADGLFATIKDGWARDVLLDHAQSVMHTSVTPEYIVKKGECLPADVAQEDVSNDLQIRVAPNPAHTTLRVQLNRPARVSVYNALSSLIMESAVASEHLISCQHLPTGMYTLMIQGRSGIEVRSLMILH